MTNKACLETRSLLMEQKSQLVSKLEHIMIITAVKKHSDQPCTMHRQKRMLTEAINQLDALIQLK